MNSTRKSHPADAIACWLALGLALLAPAGAWAATVTTDCYDYAPFSNVYVDGAGWADGETVTVRIEELLLDGSRVLVQDLDGYDAIWSVQAINGTFTVVWYVWSDQYLGSTLEVTATGEISGTATTTFTDSGGSYSINFAAADPEMYIPPIPFPEAVTPIAERGNGDTRIPSAWFRSPGTGGTDVKVESLAPEDMALHQIVPFEIKVTVSGSTAPENGVITFTAGWNIDTSNNSDFGYDESYGVYAAFVDTGDGAHLDPGGDAKVQSYSWAVVGDEIQGTFVVSGLNDGDVVVVEAWLVLEDWIPAKNDVGGNVPSRLISAKTVATPSASISTGNQTVPLLQVDAFYNADADVSVTKTASSGCLGGNLTYTIVVANAASSLAVANGIVATDTLGANQTFVSASGAPYTQSGQVITFTVGALAPGQSVTLTVVATATAAGTVNNSVAVTAITDDPAPGNNSASVTTTVHPLPVCAIAGPTGISEGSVTEFTAPGGYGYSWSVTGAGAQYVAYGSTASQTLTIVAGFLPDGVESANFTVALTLTDLITGCASTCSKTITLGPTPEPRMVYEPPCFPCGGDPVTAPVAIPTSLCTALTALGATYHWYIDGAMPAGVATIVDVNACSTSVTVYGPGTFTINLDATIGLVVLHFERTFTVAPDLVPPTLFGCPDPDGGTYQCLSQVPPRADVTATDVCRPGDDPQPVLVMFSETQSNPGSSCNNTITRTWSATDGCQTVTCSQTITVSDDTAPTPPANPATVDYECAADVPAAQTLTALDNCGATITGVPSDSTDSTDPCNVIITRTWTFTDACGNSSTATQIITVSDDTAPSITCPQAKYMNCGQCSVDPAVTGEATGTDNCSGELEYYGASQIGIPGYITYYDSHAVNASDCPWTIQRTWVATDACGNRSTCEQNITCVPYSWAIVTDSSLCTFEDLDPSNDCRDFRLLFRTGAGGYELVASNPGQTYYNVFYPGTVGEEVTFNLEIPYPYVTQGAMPIHAYSGVTVSENNGQYCLTPSGGFYVDGTQITLDNYSPQAMGETTTLTVTLTVPGSIPGEPGFIYLNVHLDYGLKKGPTKYVPDANGNATDGNGVILILNGGHYMFSVSIPDGVPFTKAEDYVCNINSFKKNPGVAGQAGWKYTTFDGVSGMAAIGAGYIVELRDSKNLLLTKGVTDEDGCYMLPYKWTGKAATLSAILKTPDGQTQLAKKSFTLKANGFVVVDFPLE